MIVVFAVLGTGLGVEEVVTSNKFKGLCVEQSVLCPDKFPKVEIKQRTMAAILQTSVLAPHFAPRITSGDRYCLV